MDPEIFNSSDMSDDEDMNAQRNPNIGKAFCEKMLDNQFQLRMLTKKTQKTLRPGGRTPGTREMFDRVENSWDTWLQVMNLR